ncbi:MAG: feruloyl-CoA synthase [Alphaproteobacteria bacterium]
MHDSASHLAPLLPVRFLKPDISLEHRPDGTIIMASRTPIAPYDRQMGIWLRRWAERTPNSVFLMERAAGALGGPWLRLSYADARRQIDRVSEGLLALGLGPDRRVVCLSEKSIGHAVLMLAASQVGIPFAPISPAYSLQANDFARLRGCLELIQPKLVYVEDGPTFERALAILPGDVVVVHRLRPPQGRKSIPLDALEASPTDKTERAFAETGEDSVAKILFTSGSTGAPKAVPNTHGEMCCNTVAARQTMPFMETVKPVLLDWQPWHHTGGGNYQFNMVLLSGGTYAIDMGKPTPEAYARTLANLRDVSPTASFNVPRGFAMLAAAMQDDVELRRKYFQDLQVISYSGASMPLQVWRQLEELAVATRGYRIPMLSSWGMTEMAPVHTQVHWPLDAPNNIGVPIPGCSIKLVPTGDGRYQVRGGGPNIFKGYLGRPDLTAKAFDEEGYFITGDAVELADPNDGNKGLMFRGRVTEEFKLMTGTFVLVGALRLGLVEQAAPLIQDCVVIGEARDEVGLLVVPDLPAARELTGQADATLAELAADPRVRAAIAEKIRAWNALNPASSRRIGRFMLLGAPPTLDGGDMTDKGYINQREAIRKRGDLIERLYASRPEADVVVLAA